MKGQLVSFETAKLAKEKGFDDIQNYIYDDLGELLSLTDDFNIIVGCDDYPAPPKSSLQDWIRDNHIIFIQTEQLWSGDTEFKIVNGIGEPLVEPEVFMYYDGKLGGIEPTLQKALNLIK